MTVETWGTIGTMLGVGVALIGFMYGMIRNLRSDMNGRFDQVDARFGQVDSRLDRMDTRLDRMDERFDRIDERFERIDERFRSDRRAL